MNQRILILGEYDGQNIKKSTLATITAAKHLNRKIDLLLLGQNAFLAAQNAAKLSEIDRVLMNVHTCYDDYLAENVATLIHSLSAPYDYILVAANTTGKNILPRVAGLLKMNQISEVLKIIDEETFLRPMYAGDVLATIHSSDPIKLLTIRSSNFLPSYKLRDQTDAAEIISLDLEFSDHRISITPNEKPTHEKLTLENARIVIAGGRGLQNAENFNNLLMPLAKKLGAALGASRAAVDAGFAPYDCQIGQTGKIIAPDLYIAIGLSGAPQHLAGIKESKFIIAINQDAHAPIVQMADLALIGDLFSIIPKLLNFLHNAGYFH